jgi:hypothetical protein
MRGQKSVDLTHKKSPERMWTGLFSECYISYLTLGAR